MFAELGLRNLRAGDRVLSVDGVPVATLVDLEQLLDPIATVHDLVVERDGHRIGLPSNRYPASE